MPKVINVTVPVTVPDDLEITDDEVAGIVNSMLDVGYADAADTAEDPDLDSDEADVITQLEFGVPTATAEAINPPVRTT